MSCPSLWVQCVRTLPDPIDWIGFIMKCQSKLPITAQMLPYTTNHMVNLHWLEKYFDQCLCCCCRRRRRKSISTHSLFVISHYKCPRPCLNVLLVNCFHIVFPYIYFPKCVVCIRLIEILLQWISSSTSSSPPHHFDLPLLLSKQWKTIFLLFFVFN